MANRLANEMSQPEKPLDFFAGLLLLYLRESWPRLSSWMGNLTGGVGTEARPLAGLDLISPFLLDMADEMRGDQIRMCDGMVDGWMDGWKRLAEKGRKLIAKSRVGNLMHSQPCQATALFFCQVWQVCEKCQKIDGLIARVLILLRSCGPSEDVTRHLQKLDLLDQQFLFCID